MSREFRHPGCSVAIVAGEAQLPASDLIGKTLIQAVIACKRFRHLIFLIDLMRLRAGDDPDLLFLSNKRARQPADQFQ
jgi:hypothetical protein